MSTEIRRFSKAKTIAQKLGVCPRTVFRWADQGMLARHKINARVVLFDEAEVLALVQSSRVQSTNLSKTSLLCHSRASGCGQ